MSRIFLARHGEVEGNSGERLTFAGWNDVPLTQRGNRQVEALAKRLERENLRAVYSSDLARARLTAEAVAAVHGLEVETIQALREVNYGEWAGLDERQILAGWSETWRTRQHDPVNVAPPGGESLADLWRRLEPAWHKIVQHTLTAGEDAFVVGHNGSIRVLICGLLGVPLENYRRVRLHNCGLSCVEWSDIRKPPVVQFVNETCHLHKI